MLLSDFDKYYHVAPLEDDRVLVNADAGEIKQHGVLSVLVEMVPHLYAWMKMKVCDVYHVYISVPII